MKEELSRTSIKGKGNQCADKCTEWKGVAFGLSQALTGDEAIGLTSRILVVRRVTPDPDFAGARRHAIPEVNRFFRFCFRPCVPEVNRRVARHVGPAKVLSCVPRLPPAHALSSGVSAV